MTHSPTTSAEKVEHLRSILWNHKDGALSMEDAIALLAQEPVADQGASIPLAVGPLVEALERLADLAGSFSVNDVYFDEACFPDHQEALRNAASLIAKARGEA